MHSRLRVLVVEAEPVMAEGIAAALRAQGAEVAVAPPGTAAPRAEDLRDDPDVCLVDRRLPGGGIDAVRALRAAAPAAVVVVFGACDSLEELDALLQAGAAGCLSRDVDQSRLLDVLTAAHRGQPVLPKSLVGQLLRLLVLTPDSEVRARRLYGVPVTPREAQVLDLLLEGRSTAAAAHVLQVAPVTVRTHVSSLLHKLGLHDREELLALAASGAATRAGEGGPPRQARGPDRRIGHRER